LRKGEKGGPVLRSMGRKRGRGRLKAAKGWLSSFLGGNTQQQEKPRKRGEGVRGAEKGLNRRCGGRVARKTLNGDPIITNENTVHPHRKKKRRRGKEREEKKREKKRELLLKSYGSVETKLVV